MNQRTRTNRQSGILSRLMGGRAETSRAGKRRRKRPGRPILMEQLEQRQLMAGDVPQTLPYLQDFSAGLPDSPAGWEHYHTNAGRAQVVGSALRLDSGSINSYSLNESILHLNLAGQQNVVLTFDHQKIADEMHPMPANFTGHHESDGVAFSVDGITWHRVDSLGSDFVGKTFDLDALTSAAGVSYSSDFRIKFQQYDNWPANTDGRRFDNIKVESSNPAPTPAPAPSPGPAPAPLPSSVSPQSLPYVQDFSVGRPGAAQGWEHYHTNVGRAEVVGGSLRLDSSSSNSYSLNESILHLNLVGRQNVVLTFDHQKIADEMHIMPTSFTGHDDSDGVAFSADGITWHRLDTLGSDFVGKTFDLDALTSAAGVSYSSDFRIKFQQYDNWPANTDGRRFDNIRVESATPAPNPAPTPAPAPSPGPAPAPLPSSVSPQSLPYVQNFSVGRPGAAQGWEHYHTNVGRAEVVGGSLRLDSSSSNSYSLNESILHLNLVGRQNVVLTFDHQKIADEMHIMPTSFTGHDDSDGVAFSADGITWHRLDTLGSDFVGKTFDLDALTSAAGVSYSSDFRIKFQQYDNWPANTDGRRFDNIRVESATPAPNPAPTPAPAPSPGPAPAPLPSSVSPQSLPYVQNFSVGRPGAAQGWEHYHTNVGRAEVVGGSLRLDSSSSNSYSLNESILHLNLVGRQNVVLTFDHQKIADEMHIMPTSFTGHDDSDGVAFSADGITWHRLDTLGSDFVGKTFDLDALTSAAGVSYSSDFRIKFQQYDNWPANTDGRRFDNIRVESATPTPNPVPKPLSVTPQALPYRQSFSAGKPGASQGWEYDSIAGRTVVSGGGLLLESDGSRSNTYNEAILHLDLTGKRNVVVKFDHQKMTDYNHYMLTKFDGTLAFDGVAFSADGTTWHRLDNLDSNFTGKSFDLDAAAAAAGVSYNSNFLIKFQQYENNVRGVDGRRFDNIVITADGVPVPTPSPNPAPTPTDDRWESNNTQASAYNLGTFATTGLRRFTGGVLRNDDWFKFRVPPNGVKVKIRVTFDSSQGNIDLLGLQSSRYGRSGTITQSSPKILQSNRDFEQVEFVRSSFGGDQFWFKVHGVNGATNPSYTIEIDVYNRF